MIRIAGAGVLLVSALAFLRIAMAAFRFHQKIKRSSRLDGEGVRSVVAIRK
jgi:hypothetical protein